jgi:hypothetical protein
LEFKIKFFIIFGLSGCFINLQAQSPNLPTDNLSYELIQDIEIGKGKLGNEIHSNIRPNSRIDLLEFVNFNNTSDTTSKYLTEAIVFLKKDNAIWGSGNYFVLTPKISMK